MNIDIEQALTNIRARSAAYEKSERYYKGDHDLRFATEKFENTFGTLFREFALNLCPVICDAVRDKLRVKGFSADSVGDAELQSYRAGKVANSVNFAARKIWHNNRMDMRAGEIHKETLKCGDAYMIVWPNARGEAVMYPNRAASMAVRYDDDAPGRITWAAKAWRNADKYVRLNMFYPDRIEKYISREQAEGTLPDAKGFVALDEPERTTPSVKRGHASSYPPPTVSSSVIANPYGIVPVFHFANNADLDLGGRSELEAAIPVQDGLNKSVLDMLVAMEFAAYRQRWAAGIEVEYDADGKAIQPFIAGAEHLWIAGSAQARFGDFEAAELDQFLKVKDSFRIDMASVTGTPLHYFLQQAGGYPSGESLRKAETRFIAKVRDRQASFGQVWADAMAFAMKIEGTGSGISLVTEWEDPAPLSDREFLENILLKKQIGLSVERALLEAGYGEADVNTMTKMNEGEK